MKTPTSILFTLSTVLAVSDLAQGFVISNCVTPKSYNLGDDKCQKWTDAKFTFQSKAGCTLMFFSGPGCTGNIILTTATQNQCLDVGGQSQSMRCSK